MLNTGVFFVLWRSSVAFNMQILPSLSSKQHLSSPVRKWFYEMKKRQERKPLHQSCCHWQHQFNILVTWLSHALHTVLCTIQGLDAHYLTFILCNFSSFQTVPFFDRCTLLRHNMPCQVVVVTGMVHGRDSCLVVFLFSAKESASCCLVTLALICTLHRTQNLLSGDPV